MPRRHAVASVPRERRAVVDRRQGRERRSTLERRGRLRRPAVAAESPAEHVRNALQLLSDSGTDNLAAALGRLRRALELLEAR